MAIKISHQAELRLKQYQTPNGNIFLEIGTMSYGIEMMVYTDLLSASRVCIGKYCSIADGVSFFPNAEHDLSRVSAYPFVHCAEIWPELSDLTGHPMTRGDIRVGNDVWIGAGAMIRDGISIGNGAVVGMGAVVVHDIPAYAIAVGNPARIARYRFDPVMIEQLEALAWWHWPMPEIRRHARLLNTMLSETVLNQLKELSSPR